MGWSRRQTLAALGVGAAGLGVYWNREEALDCVEHRDPEWSRPGRQWSPPAVRDRTAFVCEGYPATTMASSDTQYRIAAFDTGGDPRWVYNEVGAGVGIPRPTGDTVYVPTGRNRVYAFEQSTGHRRWWYDAGERVTSSGAFSRPAVTDGVVAVTLGDPGADRFGEGDWLVGLDRDDGTERWSHPLDADIWSTAVRAADTVVSVTDRGDLLGVDPSSGERRWRTAVPAPAYGLSPGAVHGDVFVAGADGPVASVDAVTGEENWSTAVTPGPSTPPDWVEEGGVVRALDATEDAVVVGDATGRIRSLDRSTGRVRWRYDDAGPVRDVAVDTDSRWVCAFDHTGVVTVLYPDTGEVRDVFRVTDGDDDSCGWPPEWRRATGIAFAPFDSVVVTGPLLGRFRLSD